MKNNRFTIFAISLLAASFAFANDISILKGVVKIENDQSIPKTTTIATLEFRPTSSIFCLTGSTPTRDFEGTAEIEMWVAMPDGNRYFSKQTLDKNSPHFMLSFNLMDARPESVTLEINIVMSGKGVVEISNLWAANVRVVSKWCWFYIFGGVLGSFWGLYCALMGCVAGVFMPRGKGRKLLSGMLIFATIMGVFQLLAGLAALYNGWPFSYSYPLILVGGILILICLIVYWMLKKINPSFPIPQSRSQL